MLASTVIGSLNGEIYLKLIKIVMQCKNCKTKWGNMAKRSENTKISPFSLSYQNFDRFIKWGKLSEDWKISPFFTRAT